jgi:hypothetical protein
LAPYLSARSLISLLQRRDRIVDHFESLIEERGEDAVLLDSAS